MRAIETWGRALVVAAAVMLAAPASAHHGWTWTSGGNIDLTGIITSVSLGNPHGVLTVDVEGEEWTVEVGQPWRNERAGLKDRAFAEGVEVRIVGEPSADEGERLVKAERVYIDGTEYPLYPERD